MYTLEDVDLHDDIEEVRLKIYELVGIQEYERELVKLVYPPYRGTLENAKTLAYYNVKDESMIYLIIRLGRGG